MRLPYIKSKPKYRLFLAATGNQFYFGCNMLASIFSKGLILLAALTLVVFGCQVNENQKRSDVNTEILFVGTFTDQGAEGIYVYRFDREGLSFDPIDTVRLVSPSFLAISNNKKYLYSANRGGVYGYPDWGSVSAFRIDNKSGALSLINTVPSYGVSPCHVSIDQTDQHLLLSHYISG